MWIHKMRWWFTDHWNSFRSRCQRFRKGWAYSDALDLDLWFINTIIPMLTYLQKHHTGHPGCMTEEEWDSDLCKMLKLLDDINDARDNNGVLTSEPEEAKDEFFSLFSKHFYHLWD